MLNNEDVQKDLKDSTWPLENARRKLGRRAETDSNAVIDLVAKFLAKLWEHTLSEIRHEFDPELLPIKVAITVPAIWPLYARRNMEAAAKKAGILEPRRIGETKLILVEEPEAAAVSTLYDRQDYPDVEVQSPRHHDMRRSVP